MLSRTLYQHNLSSQVNNKHSKPTKCSTLHQNRQEAQLSQRDRTTLHVIEYLAKSFEMTMLSRVCVSPYQYSVETMSISCTISEIFSIKEWSDLETGDRGQSKSQKMAPFDRPYMTFYWSDILYISLCCTVSELFDVE